MKVLANEVINENLELVVVRPDSKDGNPPSDRDCELEEKLGIELYNNFPFLAKYMGRYQPIGVEGCDLEDDLESAIGTMLAQAEFHRNNPDWIVEKIRNYNESEEE